MQADFYIHSNWGDHVTWLTDFSQIDLNKDTARVYGHLSKCPRVGDTLIGEFQNSIIKFEFVSVNNCSEPSDMFFGDVKAIEQEPK